jgi:hypothetical protein
MLSLYALSVFQPRLAILEQPVVGLVRGFEALAKFAHGDVLTDL